MRAVILAGGRGTRLAPYTTILPKPLMPVDDMPIVEILLRRLGKSGVTRATLAVGYLASLVMAYCGSGERLGIPIDYSIEPEPLGTAGPIGLIPDLDETFLAMNGDLLTDLDFQAMTEFHRRQHAVATVGLYTQNVKIDLGVIESKPDGVITRYVEKPTYRYNVSMGVYVFEPVVLNFVPRDRRFDLPDLIQSLIEANQRVLGYVHSGFWIDIGRPDDYARAQEDFPHLRSRILDGSC